MQSKKLSRKEFLRVSAITAVGLAAASCAQPTAQVIEKEVPVEKIVKETVIVEKQVAVEKVVKETVVVQKEVAIEKVVTATPVPSKFHESPLLAELVRAGKLPPVEERLPENPCVIEGLAGIGKYGGTMRRRFKGPSDSTGPRKQIEESMWWFDVLTLELRANVIESWQINSDASEWTMKLRKGMKWSDGHPFDASAFTWNYENVLLNEDLTSSPPS